MASSHRKRSMKRTRRHVSNAASSTAMAVRRRVQRPLSEEQPGRSIQPVGDEVGVRGGDEEGRRHGRRKGRNDKCRCGHRGTHAAHSAGAAFEFRELVQVVGEGRPVLIIVDRGSVHVASKVGFVLVMAAHRMFMHFSGRTGRSRKHPMVVRAAVDHGRSRETLKGQRKQQYPHHYTTKTSKHRQSVERNFHSGFRNERHCGS